jgi:prepilin-type N-terminal cleavage/methylation domain-containing protein
MWRSGFVASGPLGNQDLEFHVRRRTGFSLIELLVVIAIVSVIASMVMPRMRELRSRSGLRSARTLLVSALAAARAGAVQMGRTASLTMVGGTLSVTAVSGTRVTPVQIHGPVSINRVTGVLFAPLAGAPTLLTYDSRGLITPNTRAMARYELRFGGLADTVCVTGAGMVLARGCVL